MKYLFVCIFLILIVSGCQTTSYNHPTKEARDFERDRYQCEKIAKRLAADAGSPDNPFIINKETKRCLELKFGWTSTES